MPNYRVTSTYGPLSVSKIVEAENRKEAFVYTGIISHLEGLGFEVELDADADPFYEVTLIEPPEEIYLFVEGRKVATFTDLDVACEVYSRYTLVDAAELAHDFRSGYLDAAETSNGLYRLGYH